MGPKKDQLEDKFHAFMGEDDDDASVGSARGSIGGKLGGLSGLRPASPGRPSLGSLTSPGKPRSSLGSLTSPGRPAGGLGGLTKPAGGLGSVAKPAGGLGGLVKPSGGPSKPAGGLGGLAKSGLSSQTSNRKLDVNQSKTGSSLARPSADSKVALLEDKFTGLSLSVGKVQADLQSSVESNVEALKSIAAQVQGLTEKTVASFKEVSNRLNQTKDDPGLQDSLDALIKNMDDEIASRGDKEAYIVVPGHDTSTVTTEEATDILKGRSVRVFGSVGKLATVCS